MSPSTLDILSSSSYPIPERLVRGRRGHVQTTPEILYGGLTVVPDELVALSAGDNRHKSSSSKSTNKSGGVGDDSKVPKRKRGRPRVLDKDENAAEVNTSMLQWIVSARIACDFTDCVSVGEPKYDSRREHTDHAKRQLFPCSMSDWLR